MPEQKQQKQNGSTGLSAPMPAGEDFPVVGIAASAGGLDALKGLFSAMPGDTGMAFVLVPHMDPSRPSLMAELIQPHSRMPIHEVQDGVDVRPDTVYIIPPHRNMKIKGGALHLAIPAEPNPQRPPMDLFFRSLAADQREKAIGVVLSGTGAYGTSGLQAIKAQGGMTMVQDPGEAAYDQMPRSAISAGVADHVLPVARMPEALGAYLEHPYITGASKSTETRDFLGRILALIRARTKYNFNDYRKNMLMRRVQRRMSLNHIKDPDSYIHMLRDNGAELEQLFRDFLIGVSSFFRDPEAFAVLAQRVIPELIQQRSQGDTPIRVWIPACAAGEEAYSIAMLFLEAMDRAQRHIPLQIFATDLDEQALKTARLGSYPDSIAEDLSPERLQRFFTKTGHQYQINKALRETVMFASQNVIGDTPLSRMDLISCRNLLIYLEPEAQHKVLSVFHFALNEGGYLFLGTSETVARQIDLFEAVAKHWRIFRRIGPSRTDRVQLPSGVNQAMYVPLPARREAAHAAPKIGTMAQELLINTYVPACVLISRKFETLYFHGATQKYLRMPSGEPTHDLLAMTEQALSAKIRSLCYQVSNTQEKEVRGDAPVKRNDHYDHVRVSVREIRHPKALTGLLLVTFEDLPDTEAVKLMDAGDNNTLVQQLELELKTTREDLQSTIEELESSNEELKASNEEMMSMNEELQSVNEELETSKEELQSLNEELNTVNNQLEEKIEQLDKTSNDLTNLLNSADITTLFLDTGLRIRRFTPSTVKLLSLMPTDIGRSIGDLSNKFNDDTLLIDARAVLEKLTPIDKHVWTDEGLCFLRRILPYRTMANQIEGIVVTFVDITPQVIADVELRRVTALLKKTSIAIIVYNLKGDITAWSRGAERMYGYTEAEALNMSALDLAPSRMHNKTRSMFAKLAQKKDIQAIETQRVTKDGRVIDIALTAAQLADERGEIVGIIVTQQDITERRRMEHELRNLNKDLQNRVAVQTAEAEQRAMQLQQREQYLSAIVETAPDAIVTINRDGVITSFNPAAERMFGYARKDAIGQDSAILVQSPPDKGAGSDWLRRFIPPKKTVAALTGEIQGQRKDSTPFPMQVSVSEIDHLGLYLLVARDITVQRNLEKEVIDVSTQEQERIGHDIHDGLGQRLTALTMITAGLEKKFEDTHKPEADLLKECLKQLREAADEAHNLSRGLAPVPIDPGGLKLALKNLAEGITSSSGIPCQLKARRSVELNNRVQALQLYRIAQEAVNNAVKHARPGDITIELAVHDGRITLRISDDGKGFNSTKGQGGGLGTHIMRYRANIIGATLNINSKKGQGTVVQCTLPDRAAARTRDG